MTGSYLRNQGGRQGRAPAPPSLVQLLSCSGSFWSAPLGLASPSGTLDLHNLNNSIITKKTLCLMSLEPAWNLTQMLHQFWHRRLCSETEKKSICQLVNPWNLFLFPCHVSIRRTSEYLQLDFYTECKRIYFRYVAGPHTVSLFPHGFKTGSTGILMAGCHTQIDKPNEDGNGEVTLATDSELGVGGWASSFLGFYSTIFITAQRNIMLLATCCTLQTQLRNRQKFFLTWTPEFVHNRGSLYCSIISGRHLLFCEKFIPLVEGLEGSITPHMNNICRWKCSHYEG